MVSLFPWFPATHSQTLSTPCPCVPQHRAGTGCEQTPRWMERSGQLFLAATLSQNHFRSHKMMVCGRALGVSGNHWPGREHPQRWREIECTWGDKSNAWWAGNEVQRSCYEVVIDHVYSSPFSPAWLQPCEGWNHQACRGDTVPCHLVNTQATVPSHQLRTHRVYILEQNPPHCCREFLIQGERFLWSLSLTHCMCWQGLINT